MPVADFAQNVQTPYFSATSRTPLAPPPPPAKPADTKTADSGKPPEKSLFDDFLDIINPLQHIPVVSTIYSALSGDKIGPLEQIAGDTLYGGLTGLATSVAGQIFAQATGKSIGDTVLALFKDDNSTKLASAATYLVHPADSQTEIATASPANAPIPYSSFTMPAVATNAAPAAQALEASLKRNNVDADLALRASYAYRHAVAQLDTP